MYPSSPNYIRRSDGWAFPQFPYGQTFPLFDPNTGSTDRSNPIQDPSGRRKRKLLPHNPPYRVLRAWTIRHLGSRVTPSPSRIRRRWLRTIPRHRSADNDRRRKSARGHIGPQIAYIRDDVHRRNFRENDRASPRRIKPIRDRSVPAIQNWRRLRSGDRAQVSRLRFERESRIERRERAYLQL